MRFDNNAANDVAGTYHQTEEVMYPECDKTDQSPNLYTENEDVFNDDTVVMAFCKVSNTQQLPIDLQHYLKGTGEPLPDDYSMPPIPDWLDIERVKRGQAFALKYMYGLNYADSLSLIFLLSSPDGLKPLIFTERSHTTQLARKRYLSTVLRVKSWYETEIWKPSSEGYKNLKCVRALHLNVSNRVNRIPVDLVHQSSNLEQKLKESDCEMLCPLLSTLKKDFQNNGSSCPVRIAKKDRIYLNQMEMSFTQFGFFGLMVVYPEKFGAKNATKEELSNFVHLWRYIGYMLGIKNEYNACRGDFDEVRQRSLHFIEYFLRPLILRVNKDWEHMARTALQGIEKFTKLRINFEVTMLYFCWVMDIETPHLLQYVGWKELALFNITKFVMTKSHIIPGFGKLFNYTIKKNVENAARDEKISKNKAEK